MPPSDLFAGALVLATIAGTIGWPEHVAAAGAAAGVAGLLADSVFGATLQARRRAGDGTLTERARDVHGTETMHATGLRWFDNDAVNLAATAVGALVAYATAVGLAP